MWERIFTVLRKEFRSVLRDPRMRMVILVLPMFQTLIFGYAVSLDVRHIRLGVLDRDQTPASRALVARFVGSSYFDVVAYPRDRVAARRLIDASDAAAILQIDVGYEGNLKGGRTAAAQLIVDGSDSNTARFVANYASSIASTYNNEIVLNRVLRQSGRTLPVGSIDLQPRAWFNDDLESRNYYVPGIIAQLVMLVSLMLTSMAVVKERRREQSSRSW